MGSRTGLVRRWSYDRTVVKPEFCFLFILGRTYYHLHLMPRSRIRGAILPLPLYVFMAWCLVKQAQGHLYLYLAYHISTDFVYVKFVVHNLKVTHLWYIS
jgi:hypothetical protein